MFSLGNLKSSKIFKVSDSAFSTFDNWSIMQELIWDQLAEQKEQENEVNNFIKACRVMEQRVTKDVHAIRTHLEKYGYKAPCDSQRHGSK